MISMTVEVQSFFDELSQQAIYISYLNQSNGKEFIQLFGPSNLVGQVKLFQESIRSYQKKNTGVQFGTIKIKKVKNGEI